MKRILTLITAIAAVCSCCNTPENETGAEKSAIDVIMSRKSVRSFTDEPVTREQMTIMLKAASAAPSAINIQPWRFVVLEDKSKFDTTFEGNFNMKIFKQASAVVVMCAETTVMRSPGEGQAPVAVENRMWRDDLGAATENFLLAAEALGLGAVWTACYPYDERMDPVKKALNLPENVVPYCCIAVGHPAGDNQPKDKWVEDRVHYEQW